jgi:hypothetical protein
MLGGPEKSDLFSNPVLLAPVGNEGLKNGPLQSFIQ